MEEKDGVVVVQVQTHCLNAAPRLPSSSKAGVGTSLPKTASARSESTTRSSTFGALNHTSTRMGSGEESIAGDEGHRSVPSKFALSRRSLCIVVLFLLGACVPDPADEPRRRVTGPNILVIITDDQRATSTLEEMPQARRWLSRSGIRFTNAYATTPLCCPSRASIYTGRYAHNHGVETNLSPDVHRLDHSSTLQRYLQEAGYRTAIVG